MKLLGMKKVRDGAYLKNYELLYENRAGRPKTFELVSRKELRGPQDLGKAVSGVSIVAFCGERMLLLREFRMSLNREVFNLCAGMLEEGETVEDCVRRELFEETGLRTKRIIGLLPPSYSAVGFSDTKTCIAFVEAEGEVSDCASANEQIRARFYDRDEVRALLRAEEFSSRSQMAACCFAAGMGKEALAALFPAEDVEEEGRNRE
ncbi:MAG TPA: NUDIX hydrolase [Candidatus Eisenbergiella merdigallinarum]|uniref:NUDIX hydrolase n=1 Tax=Candidatus Eisenbergiella merdigallinarum TaxID=2838552 RepID=A0A9D2MQA5_9FIRM|nr:NUDIX hydrolase [Candidatus Eisenbergiella merdigallinarum]